jgi:hypothetical protein
MLIKWKKRDFLEFVPAPVCHKKIPEMACEFYLSKMDVDKRCIELPTNVLRGLGSSDSESECTVRVSDEDSD